MNLIFAEKIWEPLKRGVHEILKFLQEKEFQLAVASSSAAAQIASTLEIAGIRKLFSTVVSGTEVRCEKTGLGYISLCGRTDWL